MMKSYSSVFFMFIMICARVWYSLQEDNKVECHARIHTYVTNTQCSNKSVFDIFLSMIDGEGSLSISGSHFCIKSVVQESHNIVKFNYVREGSYYILDFGSRTEESIKFFNVLKNSDNRLKIEPLNHDDYIVSTPFETLMMCTTD